MLNGKKNIGLVLFDEAEEYQSCLVDRLSQIGKVEDYNLLVFTATTIYGNESPNAIGEANIINLIPYEKMDGMIVCHDTFNAEWIANELYSKIRKRCECPVVSLRQKQRGFYSVLVDDSTAISAAVRHFYKEHNLDRIAFLSGPFDHPEAISRLKCYRKTMKSLKIDYPEEYIYEGNFWSGCAAGAAEHFMSLDNVPQAIVCANDYMALALCKELVARGVMVPDTVAIAGFDDIIEAEYNIPSLTTGAVSTERIAECAINTIKSVWAGENIKTSQYVPTELVIRNSCRCRCNTSQNMIKACMHQKEIYDKLLQKTVNNSFDAISLESLENAENIGAYIKIDQSPNEEDDFYLCLAECEGDTYPKTFVEYPGYSEKSKSIYSVKHGKNIKTTAFKTEDLLPKQAIRKKPMTIYFYPVHYLQNSFGYIATTFKNFSNKNRIYHEWITIISNTIEGIRISQENKKLLKELNDLYVQDPLTTLYNRRGFNQFSEKAFEDAKKQKLSSMILGIDMDNLKTVNDSFGHAHGDKALRAIADAILAAEDGDDICARVGGDEFMVYGTDYDKEKAEKFLERFYMYLEKFNKKSNLPYTVSASAGYAIASPASKKNLEYFINLSDNRLYKTKRARKESFGDLSVRK